MFAICPYQEIVIFFIESLFYELFTFHVDSLSIGNALSHLVFGQALIYSVIGLAHTANNESVFSDEKVGLLLGRIDGLALQERRRNID